MRGALSEFGAHARDDDAALVAIRRISPEPEVSVRLEAGALPAASRALMEHGPAADDRRPYLFLLGGVGDRASSRSRSRRSRARRTSRSSR